MLGKPGYDGVRIGHGEVQSIGCARSVQQHAALPHHDHKLWGGKDVSYITTQRWPIAVKPDPSSRVAGADESVALPAELPESNWLATIPGRSEARRLEPSTPFLLCHDVHMRSIHRGLSIPRHSRHYPVVGHPLIY